MQATGSHMIMNFDEIPQDTLTLYSAFVNKTKRNRNGLMQVEIFDSERNAYNLYHRLYRQQKHRHEKAKELSCEWKNNNGSDVREYRKKYAVDNPEKVRQDRLNWHAKNRHKTRAHRRLHYAIRCGLITRPDTCSDCGYTGRIIGHHSDYSKPLDVEWLCDGCHKDRHHENRKVFTSVSKKA